MKSALCIFHTPGYPDARGAPPECAVIATTWMATSEPPRCRPATVLYFLPASEIQAVRDLIQAARDLPLTREQAIHVLRCGDVLNRKAKRLKNSYFR